MLDVLDEQLWSFTTCGSSFLVYVHVYDLLSYTPTTMRLGYRKYACNECSTCTNFNMPVGMYAIVVDGNFGASGSYFLDAVTTCQVPTDVPTDAPSDAPSDSPTDAPTDVPSVSPTDAPTISPSPIPLAASSESFVESTPFIPIVVAATVIVLLFAFFLYRSSKKGSEEKRETVVANFGNSGVGGPNAVFKFNRGEHVS